MSRAQRESTETWVREAAKTMLLADWTIDVEHQAPAEDAHAEIGLVGSHLHARVAVDAQLFQEPDAYVLHVLLHELCHLHEGDLSETVTEIFEAGDSVEIGKIVSLVITRHIEQMVDQLAKVLAQHPERWPSIEPLKAAVPLESV